MVLLVDFLVVVVAVLLIGLWAGPRVRDGRVESKSVAAAIAVVIGATPILLWLTGVWRAEWYIVLPGALFIFVVALTWGRLRAAAVLNTIRSRDRR